MTRRPFTVTHEGVSLHCAVLVDGGFTNIHLEVMTPYAYGNPDRDRAARSLEKRARAAAETLNDLHSAGMSIDMLRAFRRSPGLAAAIVDPALTALEELREALGQHTENFA